MDGPAAATILEQLQQINAKVQELQARLDVSDARANANSQRFSNFRISHQGGLYWMDVAYVPVVKYIPGHPFLPHPNLSGVQFAQDNPVDSQPPANLLPANYCELTRWVRLTLGKLRQRIRAVFWFYNDQRFQLPDDATLELCQDTIQVVLDDFLRLP